MFKIGCDWCAYCFDEALMYRASLRSKAESEKAELEAELKSVHAQAVSQPEWGGF